MNILTLNAGSSTLKYKLFAMPGETVLAEGSVDHPGGDGIGEAAVQAIDGCRKVGIDAVGHRVVHGGDRFYDPERMTADTLRALKDISDLDPLHNPTEVAMIEAGMKAISNVPAVAVFDTAFHRTLPEIAWRYAIARDHSESPSLRRYGFHGISYSYVSGRLLACMERPAEGSRLIVCHLGSGASICALLDGVSVNTSMGFTPVEGLVMATRSGDVDPGLLLYLMRTRNLTPLQVDDMLNHRSGLLGVSGLSGDVRVLENAAHGGNENAELALEMFAYRVSKYIGAYAAALDGVDAVAFTGGIGEHSSDMRGRICGRLKFLGLTLSAERNEAHRTGDAQRISTDDSTTQAWVIQTNEELQIARAVYQALTPG